MLPDLWSALGMALCGEEVVRGGDPGGVDVEEEAAEEEEEELGEGGDGEHRAGLLRAVVVGVGVGERPTRLTPANQGWGIGETRAGTT